MLFINTIATLTYGAITLTQHYNTDVDTKC